MYKEDMSGMAQLTIDLCEAAGINPNDLLSWRIEKKDNGTFTGEFVISFDLALTPQLCEALGRNYNG